MQTRLDLGSKKMLQTENFVVHWDSGSNKARVQNRSLRRCCTSATFGFEAMQRRREYLHDHNSTSVHVKKSAQDHHAPILSKEDHTSLHVVERCVYPHRNGSTLPDCRILLMLSDSKGLPDDTTCVVKLHDEDRCFPKSNPSFGDRRRWD